jgi:hypothetical protein
MCAFPCGGCFGSVLSCPNSLAVGEEVVLSAFLIDDALEWTIDYEGESQAVFILPDGTEDTKATTSVIGDPGFAPGRTEIAIRAESAGTVRIQVEERVIGPGIGLPPPLGGDTCTIGIQEASERLLIDFLLYATAVSAVRSSLFIQNMELIPRRAYGCAAVCPRLPEAALKLAQR